MRISKRTILLSLFILTCLIVFSDFLVGPIIDFFKYNKISFGPHWLRIPNYTVKFREEFAPIQRRLEKKWLDLRAKLVSPAENIKYHPSQIAIVTLIGSGISIQQDLKAYIPYGLSNIIYYANKHRYPFFFQHHLKLHDRELFWEKVTVILDFLLDNLEDGGGSFKWILWTDVDVLFLRTDLSLETFIMEIPSDAHMAIVLECHATREAYLRNSVRSGFFLVRVSQESVDFFQKWLAMASEHPYNESLIPEQLALQSLFSEISSQNSPFFHIFPATRFHCYAECAIFNESFSIHFPNKERKHIMKDWFWKLSPHENTIPIYWPFALQ